MGLPVSRAFFPSVNQLKSTGVNDLAQGHPIASRQVIFNNSADDHYRVTYAVDVYANALDAKAAYQEAVDKSLAEPSFQPLPDPKIGQQSFAGTSSGEGGQVHVGVGVRIGNIVIGVTRAGFDSQASTVQSTLMLTRLQTLQAAVTVPLYSVFGLL
jgi:hypothetical protein